MPSRFPWSKAGTNASQERSDRLEQRQLKRTRLDDELSASNVDQPDATVEPNAYGDVSMLILLCRSAQFLVKVAHQTASDRLTGHLE